MQNIQDIRDTIRLYIQLAEIGIFSVALFLFIWGAIYLFKPFIRYVKTNKKIRRYLIIFLILILPFFFILFLVSAQLLPILFIVIFFLGLKILIDFQFTLKDNPELVKKVSLVIISYLLFTFLFILLGLTVFLSANPSYPPLLSP